MFWGLEFRVYVGFKGRGYLVGMVVSCKQCE